MEKERVWAGGIWAVEDEEEPVGGGEVGEGGGIVGEVAWVSEDVSAGRMKERGQKTCIDTMNKISSQKLFPTL